MHQVSGFGRDRFAHGILALGVRFVAIRKVSLVLRLVHGLLAGAELGALLDVAAVLELGAGDDKVRAARDGGRHAAAARLDLQRGDVYPLSARVEETRSTSGSEAVDRASPRYCDVDLTPKFDYDLEKAQFLNCNEEGGPGGGSKKKKSSGDVGCRVGSHRRAS